MINIEKYSDSVNDFVDVSIDDICKCDGCSKKMHMAKKLDNNMDVTHFMCDENNHLVAFITELGENK